jgi:hypothetical protein
MKNGHRASRSQVEIEAINDEKFISRNDTLSSISEIEREENQVQGKINESREDYAHVLGHLTGRTSPQLNVDVKSAIGSKLTRNKLSTQKTQNSKKVISPKKRLEVSRSSYLPTLTSRVSTKKIEPATRMRKYNFKFKKDDNDKQAEIKYDIDTIQDMRIQSIIIHNEICCLLDKSKLLQNENLGVALYHFKKVTLFFKRSFNCKFERL